MPTLLTAPAGAGKTTYAIHQILEAKMQNPWQTVWVLLPTELQISVFRERLLEVSQADYGEHVLFGVEYLTFYELYSRLLDHMNLPQRQLDRGSVYRVLRHVINQLSLDYFSPIAAKPGFIELVREFIYDLKQARIFPNKFEKFAQKTGSVKDRDLAKIYSAYQDWVNDEGAVDREGAGWLALEKLNDNHLWLQTIGMLVVDGFLNFSPLQSQLLEILVSGIQKTLITLTYQEPRAATAHRIFARTRGRLLQWEKVSLEEHVFSSLPQLKRHPVLNHIEKHFLESSVTPIPAMDAVLLIEAPDIEQEVRGVLRCVKKLLLERTLPEQIVILARDMEMYADLMRSVAHSYEVPVVFRRGLQLSQSPVIAALINLLDLHNSLVNFRRQAVLDLLNSPYFDFGFLPAEVQVLEQVSLQFQVIQSREAWMEAIQQSQEQKMDEEGEIVEFAGDPQALAKKLIGFFDRITPPQMGTILDFVTWLEELLGSDEPDASEAQDHIHFYRQLRAGQSEAVISRDLQAMHGFRACLQDMLSGYDLLGQSNTVIEWRQFQSDVRLSIEQHRAEPEGGIYRRGRVLVTSTMEARGLPHDHVFIMGLVEGVFPAQILEDPLYSDRERQHFNEEEAYQSGLPTAAENQTDVATFYECLAIAQQSLTLSRPTLDDAANPWPPSILWRTVQNLLTHIAVIRYRAGEAPTFEQAATLREAGIALADRLQRGQEASSVLNQVYGWLENHEIYGEPWSMVVKGRTIENRRENPRLPFDHYSGILRQSDLVAIVAKILDERKIWSATQFNDYGYCPFRFFSKRLLKLEALEEPIEGFDAAQLGSLQHAILEYTYKRIAEEGLVFSPENTERALQIMNEEANWIFLKAPLLFGFRATRLWRQEQAEIRKRLQLLLQLDFSNDEDNPFVKTRRQKPVAEIAAEEGERQVYALEAAFGIDEHPPAIITGRAGNIKARGMIDRIDRVGNSLIVIDYKSGSKTPDNNDIEAGRNFQMMLYLLAAQQIIKDPNLHVAAGMFWSVRTREAKGQIRADDPLLDDLREKLHDYILAGRAGHFQVKPRKQEDGKCFKYCEFHQFCRITHSVDGASSD